MNSERQGAGTPRIRSKRRQSVALTLHTAAALRAAFRSMTAGPDTRPHVTLH